MGIWVLINARWYKVLGPPIISQVSPLKRGREDFPGLFPRLRQLHCGPLPESDPVLLAFQQPTRLADAALSDDLVDDTEAPHAALCNAQK